MYKLKRQLDWHAETIANTRARHEYEYSAVSVIAASGAHALLTRAF